MIRTVAHVMAPSSMDVDAILAFLLSQPKQPRKWLVRRSSMCPPDTIFVDWGSESES